jgi:hypothetical protein
MASADLLGQGNDDARGAAEVAEQEDALELCHLAEEFGAVARRRATVSWMSSTANMTRCRPSVFGGGFCGPPRPAAGAWYLVSSSLLWPSGVRIIAISLRAR